MLAFLNAWYNFSHLLIKPVVIDISISNKPSRRHSVTQNRLAVKANPVLVPLNYFLFALVLTILLIGCALSFPLVAYAQEKSNQINNVRLWHSPDKTRVVFDVSEDIEHTVFSLKNPERLVVDIQNAGLKAVLPSMQAENRHLIGVRSGAPREGVLRFVFELKKPLQAHSFVLTPNELYGYRLVLDLIDPQAELASTNAGTGTNPAGELEPNESQANETVAPDSVTVTPASPPLIAADFDRTKQKITVAIDAGHGGEDPGATGHRGSREKKITLSIAKRLQKAINSDSRMQAFLVREGDYYIDLTRRRTMAREKGADIFVSIHADAFNKKSANGLSVFALSQRGATSAMARALAKKENAADLIGGVSLANKDAVLQKVLVDLSMTNTISESVNLGGRVLKELAKVGRLHSKRVEQASFVVLKSPDIPSILIETGFITNLNEEKKLRTSSYQNKIAKAVYRALVEYYEQTPYYSQANYSSPSIDSTNRRSEPKQHKIKRGDSLSSIALKYGTTVAELKRLNNLKSNTAVLGKRLKLPKGKNVVEKNASSNVSTTIHIVKRGDSLSKISSRYNVTINALKRANGLTKNSVYEGQKIKIPGDVSSFRAATKHTVKRGDTLSEIAEKYGVTISSIMRANGLRSRTVRLGKTLKIPR